MKKTIFQYDEEIQKINECNKLSEPSIYYLSNFSPFVSMNRFKFLKEVIFQGETNFKFDRYKGGLFRDEINSPELSKEFAKRGMYFIDLIVTDKYFFEDTKDVFDFILNFYQTNKTIKPFLIIDRPMNLIYDLCRKDMREEPLSARLNEEHIEPEIDRLKYIRQKMIFKDITLPYLKEDFNENLVNKLKKTFKPILKDLNHKYGCSFKI